MSRRVLVLFSSLLVTVVAGLLSGMWMAAAAGSTQTVGLEVTAAPNVPPLARGDTATVDEEAVLVLDVVANDEDPDGDPLALSSVLVPAGDGSGTISGTREIVYTPTNRSSGYGTVLTYTVSDGSLVAEGPVTVTVTGDDDPPVAVDDHYVLPENGRLDVEPPGIMANDWGEADQVLVPDWMSLPQHGVGRLKESGALIYTPTVDFCGEDAFDYLVVEGGDPSQIATVTLTVACDPPRLNLAPVGGDAHLFWQPDSALCNYHVYGGAVPYAEGQLLATVPEGGDEYLHRGVFDTNDYYFYYLVVDACEGPSPATSNYAGFFRFELTSD